MNFIRWYKNIGLPGAVEISSNFLLFVKHYFSLGRLSASLFSPWKKLLPVKKKGFALGKWFDEVSYELVSRMIGFVVRGATIVTGLAVMLVVGGVIILVNVVLVLCPFLMLPIYFRWKKEKNRFVSGKTVGEMVKTLEQGRFWKFLSLRTGISLDELAGELKLVTIQAGELLDLAYQRAKRARRKTIDETDVGLVLCQRSQGLQKLLEKKKIDLADVENICWWFEHNRQQERLSSEFWGREYLMSIKAIGKDWVAGYTNNLDRLAEDLSDKDMRWVPFVGRDEEVEFLYRELSRDTQPHVLIYGEPGMGRHSLMQGLAKKIQWHELDRFRHFRVVMLSAEKFVGSTEGNQAGAELVELIHEAETAGNVILVIDHLELLVSRGKGRLDLSSALEKALQESHLPLIGLTNKTDYFQWFRGNEMVMKLFTPYELQPLGTEAALKVVMDRVNNLERRHGVEFSYSALKTLVNLTDRFVPGPFPEKAIDLLGELVAESRRGQNLITEATVEKVLSQNLRIPLGEIHQSEKQVLLELEEVLKREIVDQDEAVTKIAKALRRSRVGVVSGNKPIGSFLMLGPTGVGKTETAKVLSRMYFGEEDLLRVDMAEFQDEAGLSRLLGNANQNNPGFLAKKILSKPYGVLLLDEFEKAPEEVHNLFLTILDEGYFTSANGARVACNNLIIIATSNAGSETLREYLKINQEGLDEFMLDYLMKERFYSPELLNRFDAVVFYRPLTQTGLKKIVRKQLEKFAQKIKENKGVEVEFDEETIEEIIASGYDENFGARSLLRYINDTLADETAKKLLAEAPVENIKLSGGRLKD